MKKRTYHAKDMAKRVGACVGAVTVSAAVLTGCNWFRPENNLPVPLYGPPSGMESPFDPAREDPQDVYGPPPFEEDYDPEELMPETVYGPPPEDEYDPADDEMAPVYGPPPEDEYDPSDDSGEWVYGPPGDDWDDWDGDW